MNPLEAEKEKIDGILISQAVNGEGRAFDALILKYQGRLKQSLTRLVQDEHEIQDIVQDAFIKAYRALPNFRGDSAFFTWLYRIAVNSAKNYLVAYKKKNTWVTKNPGDDEFGSDWLENFPDSNTPETDLVNQEILQTLQQTLAVLPDDLRETIRLREIEGLSYDAIGAAMNCPVGTVRSRLFRARELIAKDLNPLLEQKGNTRW